MNKKNILKIKFKIFRYWGVSQVTVPLSSFLLGEKKKRRLWKSSFQHEDSSWRRMRGRHSWIHSSYEGVDVRYKYVSEDRWRLPQMCSGGKFLNVDGVYQKCAHSIKVESRIPYNTLNSWSCMESEEVEKARCFNLYCVAACLVKTNRSSCAGRRIVEFLRLCCSQLEHVEIKRLDG